METEDRERLRMRLLTAGVKYLEGHGDGSGDSASDYYVQFYTTHEALGNKVEVYKFTGQKQQRWGMGSYTDATFRKVTDAEGKVITDALWHNAQACNADESDAAFAHVPWHELAEMDGVDEALKDDAMKMFDAVVDDNAWWHFNDAGSCGTLFWDLEQNIARVSGYIRIEDTEDMGDGDPLGIEADRELDEKMAKEEQAHV